MTERSIPRKPLLNASISTSLLSLVLLTFCCAGLTIGANRQPPQTQNIAQGVKIAGCLECGIYRCPDSKKCLLGTAEDPCRCCPEGICARHAGESCWSPNIPNLPAKRRNEGHCAANYECKLRADLHDADEPEAICQCKDQNVVCGTNNVTYLTPCELHEESLRQRNAEVQLSHTGPCQSRPWIVSPLVDVTTGYGQRVALNCEVKGFPIPDIFWEFHSADGKIVEVLPTSEHEATVNTREGPEPFMRTSWMQLSRVDKNQIGTYNCIANNSNGEASSAARVLIA